MRATGIEVARRPGMERQHASVIAALFIFAISACSPTANDESSTSKRAIAASEQSARELGVTEWKVSNDAHGMSLEGVDGSDAVRAAVGVRSVYVGDVRWVEIGSATNERAAFRFRIEGGKVIWLGLDSIWARPSAWRAVARADADLRAGASADLATASLHSPELHYASKLVNDMGACLTFAGQVVSSVGMATGNDALSACGDACQTLGDSMTCYDNYQ